MRSSAAVLTARGYRSTSAALCELSLHLADVARQVVFLAAEALVELGQLGFAGLDPILAKPEGGFELDLTPLDRELALVEVAQPLLQRRLQLGELPLAPLDIRDAGVQQPFRAAQRTFSADQSPPDRRLRSSSAGSLAGSGDTTA